MRWYGVPLWCCFLIHILTLFGKEKLNNYSRLSKEQKVDIEHLLISPLVELIVKRGYFIARFQQIPLTLDTVPSYFWNHSIDDLMSLWDDIRSFKFLEDKMFVLQFIKKSCDTLCNLAECMGYFKDDTVAINYKRDTALSLAEQIYLIDYIVEVMGQKKGQRKMPFGLYQQDVTDIAKDLSVIDYDVILMRFYQLKRFDKVFKLLATAYESRLAFLPITANDRSVISASQLKDVFTHYRIRCLIDQIFIKKSIKPLLLLWKYLQHYRYISDEVLVKQVVILTIFICQSFVLSNQMKQSPTQFAQEGLFSELYMNNAVHLLSTEQVMNDLNEAQANLALVIEHLKATEPWYQKLVSWWKKNKYVKGCH